MYPEIVHKCNILERIHEQNNEKKIHLLVVPEETKGSSARNILLESSQWTI